jgi:hypothetical protein
MNRKAYTDILAFLTCLTLGFLTGCSSSSSSSTPPTPTVAISATAGATQNAAVGAAFPIQLQATVTSNGSPASGVSVTFAAPASGASGTFATSPAAATDTETTNSSGVATSQVFTANTTAGSYTVTATATGASTPASFSLTNTAGPATTITATGGATQNTLVSTPFPALLAATVVDSHNSPVGNVTVTFTTVAASNGASGTFSGGATTTTATTGTNGVATISAAFTANAIAGSYTVTATFTGASAPATFNLTNNAATVSNTYVFYLSGQEGPNTPNGGVINYYAIAGAVTIDANGDVITGEQDYNDGIGNTSPGEPNTPDSISAATKALNVDSTTGIGTLTLTTNNPNVGPSTNPGVETFAVQFVNAKHALITQFDGSATSSGSLDLQTATSVSGNFAFAITGTNDLVNSVAFGGVFTTTSSGATGTIDVNDFDGGQVTGTTFNATFGTTDGLGRTVVTGISNPALGTPINFVSYVVGPEALRIIDVDPATSTAFGDAAVGSAFGQGTTTFTNASLGSSVFTLLGQWSAVYATLGQFGTDGNGNITSGIADDNELDNGLQQEAVSITSSTYNLLSSGINGYGTMTMSGTGDVIDLGLYMTDPLLNLNDPNNTTTDLGGALIVDLDAALPGGMGVITPQTPTTAADFAGSYAAGFQNYNQFTSCFDCELDMVGPFTMVSGGLLSTQTIGADDSDPFGTWDGTPAESTGDSFSSTPLAVSPGYFSMSQANTTPNALAATIGGTGPLPFDADIYQASATTLYWLEFDLNGMFLGPIEAQGSFSGAPFAKRSTVKPQAQPKTQTIKGLGGHVN